MLQTNKVAEPNAFDDSAFDNIIFDDLYDDNNNKFTLESLDLLLKKRMMICNFK